MKLILKSILYGLIPILFIELCVLVIFSLVYFIITATWETLAILVLLIVWIVFSVMTYSDFKHKRYP